MKFSFVLAFAVVFNAASTATAQQTKAVVVTPCTNETPPQSTLKRRQKNPDDQPKVEQVNGVIAVTPRCNDGSVESDIAAPAMSPESSGQPLVKPVTIKFEGLTVIEESDVRGILRNQNVNRALDSGITSESIAGAESLIKELLSDYGYRHAAVSSRVEKGADELPLLTLVISEGPRFTISDIRFVGNRVFSEQVLSTEINRCLAYGDRSPKVYRSGVFDYCTHMLANFERSQGYLQAKFSEPKVEEIGTSLVITVESNEGPVYSLGLIEIEGFDHVAEHDIRALIDMRWGDVVNGEKLSKALYEKLKAVYGEKGFIQYTAEAQPKFHLEPGAAEGVVDFMVTIDEGRRFKVGKVSFRGEDLPENELRQMLLLREGDVYNQKLFEQSIRRINETGRFQSVDKDKDVDYRTNEEEDLVFVAIKLVRLEKDINRGSVP